MFRQAARALYRNPRFTTTAVLTLALAIAANTAIFSLVNALLLRPITGVEDPDQLVTLKRLQLNNPDYVFGYPDFLDYRSRTTTLSGLAAHIRCSVTSTDERLRADLVSRDYFRVLGVRPAIGRLLDAADDGAEAVLSHGMWQRSFASSASVLGSEIQLNGHSFTVVGVAGPQFLGTVPGAPVDVWLPLTMQPIAIPRLSDSILQSREAGWINIFGRRRPGAGIDQARAELKTIAGQMARAYPQTNEHRGVDVLPGVGLDPDDKATLSAFFGLLLAAVGALMLMAATNVAGLMLIRAAARQREMAIRRAIGASRGHIVGQLLTEGGLISLMAALAGVLLAPWAARFLLAFRQPLYATAGLDTTPDFKVLAFTLAVSLAAGVAFSLVPALQAGSPGPVQRRSRSQSALIAVQVAVALLLLAGASLAIRTMRNVLSGDLGFQSRNLLLVPANQSTRGYMELVDRVSRLPGVQSASLASTVPPKDFSGRISVFYEGQAPAPGELTGHEFELGLRVDADTIAPGFFRTMEIPMPAGRDFSARDNASAPRVAIVSAALARHLWPNGDAVGRHIEIPSSVEIVGIAKDIKYRSLLLPAPLLIYLPLLQNQAANQTLVVRTAGDPAALLAPLRSTGLPIYNPKTLSDEIAESLWQQQMAAGLIGGFGILALLLAGIGIYSVIAHWVARGTHDIGIRIAIGAQRADILAMVLRRGLMLTLAGLALGIPAALVTDQLLAGMLYGTTPQDPLTFGAVSLLVVGTALAATSVPALRATRVDPVAALRTE